MVILVNLFVCVLVLGALSSLWILTRVFIDWLKGNI